MKNWLKIFMLFFLLTVSYNYCFAILKTLPIETGQTAIKTFDKSTKKVRWQSTILTVKTNFNDKPYIYTEEIGKGIYGKDNTYKNWITKGYYEIYDDKILPYEVKIEIKDSSGKIISYIEKSYNYNIKKVVCNVNGKTKTLDLNPNTIDRDIIGRVLPNFPFESKEEIKFYLITHEPSLYNVTIKNLGKEIINFLNKEIECYKLELIPDLGALNLVGAFVPKTYFWYTTEKPHRFIRYEGLESGLGTPVIIMENAN